jgi:hypothetical protein
MSLQSRIVHHRHRKTCLALFLLICGALLAVPNTALGEGSRTLYPRDSTPDISRANLEWRTDSYGGENFLSRRTLLKVYANAGEYILLGSSAVGVESGNILVYNPNLVEGEIGRETIPPQPSFSCEAQRSEPGAVTDQGRIASREEEVIGPNTIDNPSGFGYNPCFYQAPVSGIYDVVFYGPAGQNATGDGTVSGLINPRPEDFGSNQISSVTAWDVTVRLDLNSTADTPGRLFAYYVAMFTGANGRPVDLPFYIATTDGFRYRADLRGDPYGFVYYANRFGFLDSDGTPLYRNVMADSSLGKFQQDQLEGLQGGVSLSPPEYPMFFDEPDPQALTALDIPLRPLRPIVSEFTFTSEFGNNQTFVNQGGTFEMQIASPGAVQIILSRDGVDFDPTNPRNWTQRVVFNQAGPVQIDWDGRDNAGEPFPARSDPYPAQLMLQGGEVHFPALDVENNESGSSITLLNPPDGVCPPWNGGCNGAFYDDRGYLTADGVLVGTAVNGPLCDDNVGNPPDPLFSDPVLGFDSSSDVRRWGNTGSTSQAFVCAPAGGFGDKKGLNLWTYYPSDAIGTEVLIIDPTSITLSSFTATREQGAVSVRWSTSAEINTWGYHLYRSADGTRANATQITPNVILARGRGQGGADYTWSDTAIRAGTTYTYWLQEIELGGATNEYGPVKAPVRIADVYQVAIPQVTR